MTGTSIEVWENLTGMRVAHKELLADSGVSEAAVVALDDPVGGKRLHAVIRRRGGAELNSLLVRNRCARRLRRDLWAKRRHPRGS